jgi:type I restriction-modification system DNA methylase subunit
MSQSTLSENPFHNSNLFTDYYLKNNLTQRDEWEEAEGVEAVFEELTDLYEKEGELVAGKNEDALLDQWIDQVLEILGYGETAEPPLPDGGGYIDRLLYESDEVRRGAELDAADGDSGLVFDRACGLLEAKQWDADFTEHFSEDRQYRDASHQVKFYLEHTPETIQWGILTDGKKWRLYGTKNYETETYYQVDLPELLESGSVEDFKYFYHFFRPEAFREVAGSTFLDTVWNESETAAQELGEDLQDNVFTALRVLGKGFVETNELEIDPDDDEALDELKEQSLVLLYRLMFILYAESRHLIDPDDPGAQREYEENFSLDQKRTGILETIDEEGKTFDAAYSEYSTSIWQRLQDLFRLIDQGKDDLGIPAYNGGLFDSDEHEFLTENGVADEYLAEVIYRISTTKANDGEFVLADYSDLDTRHLGSIYEGLLEHEFRIAPEQYVAVSEDGGQVWKPATEVSVADAVETVSEKSLYVVNDEGERKATGSYYTPDYVVTYIVEETVDPLIDDIEADLAETDLEPGTMEYVTEFWKQVKGLKVLDPAMGSGHFLTKATGYIAEQVMNEVRELEKATVFNEKQIRREVSKECIYGVDLNGMAVELAKLSMWLETLASDQPLAFLDHHLKTGNSLVGSDISEILSTDDGDDVDDDDGTVQTSVFDWMEQARRRALTHVMDLMQDLLAIENESLTDIKAMEQKYEEVRDDPLFTHLMEMASVHTASQFGLDVPDDADEQMAKALRDESWADVAETDWFKSAQAMADTEEFFHWELEFPEVFFSEGGEVAEDAGFDAVVGNPPYIKIHNLRATAPEFTDYAIDEYQTASGRFDIYSLFVEKGSELGNNERVQYILPNKFFESGGGKPLRKFLTDNSLVADVLDFKQYQVFEGATTYTCILGLQSNREMLRYGVMREEPESIDGLRNAVKTEIPLGELDSDNWALTEPRERKVLQKLRKNGQPIGEISEHISEGIVSGDNEIFFVEILEDGEEYVTIRSDANNEEYVVESELVHTLVDGDNIMRYTRPESSNGVIYPYEIKGDQHTLIEESSLENKYPRAYSYLSNFRKRLETRGTENMNYPSWYALWCPRNKSLFESPKIVTPDICKGCEFSVDDSGGIYLPDTAYGIVLDDNHQLNRHLLLAVLNNTVTWFFIYHTSPILRGDFRRFKTSYLSPLPIPDTKDISDAEELPTTDLERWSKSNTINEIPTSKADALSYLGDSMLQTYRQLHALNRSLLDHLRIDPENSDLGGKTLPEIGFSQPPKDSADSILNETTETRDKLQIERSEVERESPNTVTIHLTARYKPEDEDGHDLDQYGYAETDFRPALRITDLTETEADLVEAFVPVAVEEAGGFAGFRDNATKTNSPIDRLKKLTLPAVDDVRDGLESYIETKERAEELDEKIERTDDLIDQIVYELYGLTDEEIEIVENAVRE